MLRSTLPTLFAFGITAAFSLNAAAQDEANDVHPQAGVLKQPGLKNFIDEIAEMIETLGQGDVDSVIARVGELGIGSPSPQDRQRIEAGFAGLRKLPPQKFERLEVTSVKSLSTRLHVFSLIAHGKHRPFFFLIAVDQYEQKWRMIHIHFSNEQKNVLGQAPPLEGGKPLISYDFVPDTVAKLD